MRLWVRLALGMTLLAGIPVAAVGLSAMEIATRRSEDASEERLRREAQSQAESVGRWVRDQARGIVELPQLYGDRLAQLSPEAQAGFPKLAYKLTSAAVTVVLVDGDGLSVVPPVFQTQPTGDRTPSDINRSKQLVDRLPLTAVVLRPEVAHMGDAWLPGGLGTLPSFPLTVLAAGGVESTEQRILGVEIELEVGEDLLATVTDTHAVALFDGAGVPILGGGHALIEPDRLRPLAGTDQPIDFRLAGDRGEIRGSLAPVPDTPGWVVLVAEPASVVLAPAGEIRARMAPTLGLALAGAVMLALVAASGISRPVERLRDAALQVADGVQGVRADIHRSDEVGELARAFDHMSARLQANKQEIDAQQAEIEAFNRELQQRVEERTAELEAAQQELVRAGQLAAVAELGAGLAHELNNPLAAVLGLAQLLKARNPDERLFVDLEAEADRCREVVATMRRVQSADADPADAPVVQLSVVLAQVHDLVGGPFRQRGVLLERGETEADLRVRLDPVQGARLLAQILNALRAGLEPGTTIVMSAAREGAAVVLRLKPNRPVAAHPDRRDDWMASGHGLWVARQLLARLGGHLDRDPDDTWRVVFPGAA